MKRSLYWMVMALAAVALAACGPKTVTLTILHTNDTHSQVEPKSNGQGGYARRMGLIAKEREADPDLILLDAGDFSQGTPYFNFFKGRVEIEAMNRMGYDASTLGNHEFDNGLDTLAMLCDMAQFPILNANYTIDSTVLKGKVLPYTVIERKGVRIGVFAFGVTPDNLIALKNFAPLSYLEPYPIANQLAEKLRTEEHCDLIILLSHLGTDPEDTPTCDIDLAKNTRGIDIIIGGHTHKMWDLRIPNLDSKEVIVRQEGKSGCNVGKIVVTLER